MGNSNGTQVEGLMGEIGVSALGIRMVNLVVGGGIFVMPGLIAVQL